MSKRTTQIILTVLLSATYSVLHGQDTFQLAPPLLKFPSIFFEKSVQVSAEFRQPESSIRYTLNGWIPTEESPVFDKPVSINKPVTKLSVRTFAKGFLPSEMVQVNFYRMGKKAKTLRAPLPHPKYLGTGNDAFQDGLGGNTDHNSKTWLGYQDSVMIELEFGDKTALEQIMINTLESQNAWIFQPSSISVYGWDYLFGRWRPIGGSRPDSAERQPEVRCAMQTVNIPKSIKTDRYRLIIRSLQEIPSWHPGKGKPAWLFIDELILH
ncbi:MAG: chitobiase/beta-hexosaminidase C-terminal domain-containing protein [Chitinophagales bacterium]|nr:chitobiase/beta-hexosaminidase C-terminal domain-containing protein [Chitinophagales bacterium]